MKPWVLGVLILFLFAILGELPLLFNEYVFDRLGLNRDTFLLALWTLPLIASFIAARYSVRYKLMAGLSYLFLFPLIASVANYLHGKLGGVVDFPGLVGTIVVFKIYLGFGSIVILIGTFLGVALSKTKPPARITDESHLE